MAITRPLFRHEVGYPSAIPGECRDVIRNVPPDGFRVAVCFSDTLGLL